MFEGYEVFERGEILLGIKDRGRSREGRGIRKEDDGGY